MSPPPPSWHNQQLEEKPNLQLLPWEGKKRVEHTSSVPGFQGTEQRTGSVSPDTGY